MRVVVVGSGYVGLVTGACLASVGNEVVCVDNDTAKIAALTAGRIPIFEPGLEDVVKASVRRGHLSFSTDLSLALAEPTDCVFIAVGTPPGEDGSADLSHVLAVATGIGKDLRHPTIVVDKSTVPVGTAERVHQQIAKVLAERGAVIPFEVVSNPEFLKEGAAVNDFMRPSRVIVGTSSHAAAETLRRLYAPVTRNHERLIVMGVREAELTKYAANAMLATRISFMNELTSLCDQLGADIEMIRKGIGSDPRIGHDFLYAGIGYGGSCFPKDVMAILRTAQDLLVPLDVIAAAQATNEASLLPSY